MHNISKPDTFSMIPASFFLWANDHFADFCEESHCFDERPKDAETRLCPLGATCGKTDGWASRRGGLWRWFGFRSQRIQNPKVIFDEFFLFYCFVISVWLDQCLALSCHVRILLRTWTHERRFQRWQIFVGVIGPACEAACCIDLVLRLVACWGYHRHL